jgi:hypothetical protein
MTKGPLGNERLVEVGPFKYDENAAPSIDSFVPPVVTDSFGHENYERQWARNNPFDAKPDSDPPHGVTGMYMPEVKRCIVDNRAYLHHPSQIDSLEAGFISNITPQFESTTNDLPDPEDLFVIPFSMVYIDEDFATRPVASLPEMSSFVDYYISDDFGENEITSFEDTTEISVDDIYSMVYALRTLGVEPQTACDVRHVFRRRFGIRRAPFLEDMYSELEAVGKLPEPRVSRQTQVLRSRVEIE